MVDCRCLSCGRRFESRRKARCCSASCRKKFLRRLRAAPPRPDKPTAFLPGDPEKVEVMRQRWAAGRQIHHPRDADHWIERMDDE